MAGSQHTESLKARVPHTVPRMKHDEAMDSCQRANLAYCSWQRDGHILKQPCCSSSPSLDSNIYFKTWNIGTGQMAKLGQGGAIQTKT